MNPLTQNTKLEKASSKTFGFGIFPAVTCPQAGECKAYCYACKGLYRTHWGAMVKAWEWRTELTTDSDAFIDAMQTAITTKVAYGAKAIRIHPEGDFYSPRYLMAWLKIMAMFPSVRFYAYTKSVGLVKGVVHPKNFTAIYSFGGKQDAMINARRDRHARIFPSYHAMRKAGYQSAMGDDSRAWKLGTRRLGLLAH